MTKFRIYNEEGKVKVKKMSLTDDEKVITDIKDGEFFEIDIEDTSIIRHRKVTPYL